MNVSKQEHAERCIDELARAVLSGKTRPAQIAGELASFRQAFGEDAMRAALGACRSLSTALDHVDQHIRAAREIVAKLATKEKA